MTLTDQDHPLQQILSDGNVYDHLLHRPLLRAARQLAEGVPVSAALRTQILDEVVAHWLRPPFWQLRSEIGNVLRDNAGSAFVLEVLDRLLVESMQIGEGTEAAIMAGQAGRKEEAAELLLRLSYNEIAYPGDDEYNVEAAVAYSQIGDREKASARLLEIAADVQYWDGYCCFPALQALVEVGDASPAVLKGLRKSLQEVPKPLVRIELAMALVQFGQSEAAIPALREIVADQSIEDSDRRRAAVVLAKAGEREIALSALKALMQNENTHKVVACRAARDRAQLGEHQIGVDFLIGAAQIGKPCINCEGITCSCGRNLIVDMLNELGEREAAISLLISFLGHDGFRAVCRKNFAAKLAQLGEAKLATPALLQLAHLPDADSYTQYCALEALGKWGERTSEVLDALLAAAVNKELESMVCFKAIEAIENFGNSDSFVLETLAEIAQSSPEPSHRRCACGALLKLDR